MRLRSTRLATSVVVAIAAVTGAGCRRQPIADKPGQDASPGDVSLTAEHPAPVVEAGPEATPDLISATDAADAPPADAPAEVPVVDAPEDRSIADTPADMTSVDTPADMTPVDRAPDTAPPDRAGGDVSDVSDVRPDDLPCGPAGFNCNPYRCDLVLGQCKTTCASDDDCVTGRSCTRGSCGLSPGLPCETNAECASGHCSRGACCTTACDQPCMYCGLPGTVGTCMPFPPDVDNPLNGCPAGNVCDRSGKCWPSACTTDTDCGVAHWCTNGRCHPCFGTCASDADCTTGAVCVHRNVCTYCWPADAGVDGP